MQNMLGFLTAIRRNLLGYDTIILILGIGLGVIYGRCRRYTNRIYNHFNYVDRTRGLRQSSKMAFGQITRPEEALSTNELLTCREKMNASYAFFTTMTSIFPLLGMLGTVISLIPMVTAIGTDAQGLIFEALTSTLWGIVFAIFWKFMDTRISYRISDNEKRTEYLLNPAEDIPKCAHRDETPRDGQKS